MLNIQADKAGITSEQYRWLARQMLFRPNKERLLQILVLSQHGKMSAQKKKGAALTAPVS